MNLISKILSAGSGASPRRRAGAVAAGLLIAVATATPGAAQAPAVAAPPPPAVNPHDGPVYCVTYLDVGSGAEAKGIALLKTFQAASRKEATNLEFTLLQQVNRPNRFAIIEGWKDQAAFDEHDKTAAKTQFDQALQVIRNSPPDRHVVTQFAPHDHGKVAAGSLYLLEHMDFLPAFGPSAPPLVKGLAEISQKDPNQARYEVYRQRAPRTNHYEVVAVWKGMKAFDAYVSTSQMSEFRTTTVWPARANLVDERLYKQL